MTLTYGPDASGKPDHFRAAFLYYADVQDYLKRLRFHGFPVRYLAVGEYGGMKGRAHWHLLLFWQERVPCFAAGELLVTPGRAAVPMQGGEDYPDGGSFNERHWPHGWSYWRGFQRSEIRYVCKYIQKGLDDPERQYHLAMSKKPPLGARFFVERAGEFVKAGLSPQTNVYSFRGVVKRNGRPREFRLEFRSLDLFLQSFLDQWAARWGGHPPHSPLLEVWQDRQARLSSDPNWTPALFVARQKPAPLPPPPDSAPSGAKVCFSEALHTYFAVVDDRRLYWSVNQEGEASWQSKLVLAPEAARRKAVAASRANPERYRAARDPARAPESGSARPRRGRPIR